MKLVVVAVGKLKERALRQTADEYLARLRHYVRCDEIEVRAADALKAALPAGAVLVALEVEGEALSSQGFAKRLARWTASGKGVVAFLVGGPDGLPSEISARADARLSLSSLTLPHRLARIVLYEQLYRAMTIQRGEPYAREN